MNRKPAKISPLEERVIDILMSKFEDSALTWDQLTERSGVPRTTVFKTLNKQRGSTINEIVSISWGLGLVPSTVIREAEESLRPTATVTDLSELRSRLESGEDARKHAALDPGYSPEDEHGPHTP